MALSPKNDTDVLIVGAGPTGLMLACELHRAGVSFRIIEKSKEPSTRSRALVVHAKTLELFQKLGLDEELVNCGSKNVTAHAFVNRRHAADFEIGDTGIDDTPFPFMLFVSQAETERVLASFLDQAKVTIERGVEAIEVDPTFGATKLSTGEAVKPRFVVGCDGAHSVVRHAGKFSFDGEPYPQDFLLADVHLKTPIDGLHLFFDDRGVFVLLPMKDGVYRIISSRVDAPDTTADPTLSEVQALADTFSSRPVELTDPIWLARFRLHHRQADRYRRGPLLLAGDAAHIHSPAGGQGMNTGIQDAANLAWKLALVCRGDAPATLLDSYDEERHPVGRQLLRTTDRLFSLNTTSDGWTKALRNFSLKYLAPAMLSSKMRRAWMFRFIAELRIAYSGSSIVMGDLGGKRAPDVGWGDTSIFAMTREHTHHLLVFGDHEPKPRAWMKIHRVGSSALARERYGMKGDGLVLLRPDGYVGMSCHRIDDAALDEYAARLELRSDQH
jgi:2-polyprenyl-6-methoxyphenol hydroxylase-like FAD-dependent oxidoreductase